MQWLGTVKVLSMKTKITTNFLIQYSLFPAKKYNKIENGTKGGLSRELKEGVGWGSDQSTGQTLVLLTTILNINII
jgi:hypothetical protein